MDQASSLLLRDFQLKTGLDFWSEPAPGRRADIMVPPSQKEWVEEWLVKHEVTFHTMVEDVHK